MIPTKEAVLPQVGNIDDPWGSWMMWLKLTGPHFDSVEATANLPSSRKGDGRSLPGLLSPESQMLKAMHFCVRRKLSAMPTYPKPPSDLTACTRNHTRKRATSKAEQQKRLQQNKKLLERPTSTDIGVPNRSEQPLNSACCKTIVKICEVM